MILHDLTSDMILHDLTSDMILHTHFKEKKETATNNNKI